MTNKVQLIQPFLVLALVGSVILSCKWLVREPVNNANLESIRDSHIDENVPNAKDFDIVLKRDLASYFSREKKKDVKVDYELLREGPTQSGASYPKYYVWVKVMERNKMIDEGAVRVAAVDKTRFDVTDFLSKSELKSDPDKADKVFPAPVAAKIKTRL